MEPVRCLSPLPVTSRGPLPLMTRYMTMPQQLLAVESGLSHLPRERDRGPTWRKHAFAGARRADHQHVQSPAAGIICTRPREACVGVSDRRAPDRPFAF